MRKEAGNVVASQGRSNNRGNNKNERGKDLEDAHVKGVQVAAFGECGRWRWRHTGPASPIFMMNWREMAF